MRTLRFVPEQTDPEARARALEALRMRLDPASAWPEERCWPAIARTLGYPSGNAAQRAAWRTFNRVAYNTADWIKLHEFVTLANAVELRPDARELRTALRELDNRKPPEDRDPPKPRKPRPLSEAAIKRAVRAWKAEMERTVDADPDPHALMHFVETHVAPRQSRQDAARMARE